MKVLHIIPGLNIGGQELFLLDLIGEKVFDSEVLILSHDKLSLKQSFEKQGIKIHAFKDKITLLKFIINKNKEFDIIQTWLPRGNFIGAVIKVLFPRKKVIWGIGQQWPIFKSVKFKNFLLNHFLAKLSFLADAYITCNKSSMLNYEKHGYLKDRFFFIPNGIKKINIPIDHKKRVFTAARLIPQKNLKKFIKISTQLLESDVIEEAVIYGDGVEREKLKSLIPPIYKNKIQIRGEVLDKSTIFKDGGIFISTSIMEGHSIALIEALSLGIPVLVTPIADNLEYFEKDQLLDDNYIHQVERIFSNYQFYSERNLKLYEENFQIKNTAEKYLNLYKKI